MNPTPASRPGAPAASGPRPSGRWNRSGSGIRRRLQAEHTAARTRLELIRAERNAARRNALDEALAPLLEVAAGLRTSAERDALAVYILRIQHAWRLPSR